MDVRLGRAGRPLLPGGIAGPVRMGPVTKQLAPCLRAGEVAVIAHDDLDSATATALIEARPAAVVNAGALVTGRVPVEGARLLLEAGVPVLDEVDRAVLGRLTEGQWVRLDGQRLLDGRGRVLARGTRLDAEHVRHRLLEARQQLPRLSREFVDNTLAYLRREAAILTEPVWIPPLRTPMAGRSAVVVVRSATARADLRAIRPFIRQGRPVLIGVDGGADALLAEGWRPDLVVGDMDSVSDRALARAREIVVHAYPDGAAPGLARLRRAGRFAHVMPSLGTSEDMAMLLAYEAGAAPVVAVGAHWGVLDFVERGRAGMASTLLVRMRVGHVLVDARGLARLAEGHPDWPAYASMVTAALGCVAALALASPALRLMARLLWMRLQTGLWLGGLG